MNPVNEFLERLRNTEQALKQRQKLNDIPSYTFALNILQTMRKDYCTLFRIGEGVEIPHEETRWANLE